MQSEKLRLAADFIGQNRLNLVSFKELPDGLQPTSLEEAYDIQWEVHEWFDERGEEYEGWKVGVTSTAMQAYMKMDTPSLGAIRRRQVTHKHADLVRSSYCAPGIELEIVVRLEVDIGPEGAPYTRQKVTDNIATMMAGFEVVDDRYNGILEMPATTMVADDFCNAGCVLGEEITDWRALDLEAIQGVMTINGDDVRIGHGRDVLGHPLEALSYVANHLARYGKTAKAGEIIMLGSLVKTAWMDAGDAATGTIKGLGQVSLSFV